LKHAYPQSKEGSQPGRNGQDGKRVSAPALRWI
jgi:hypothetical protein